MTDLQHVDLDGLAGWVELLGQVAAKRAELDLVEAAARERIEAALGAAEEGRLAGRPAVRWHRTAAPRRFDAKRFRRDHPNLAEAYTVTGEPGRRFTLVTDEETG